MIEISSYYTQNTIEHPQTITLLSLKSINTLREMIFSTLIDKVSKETMENSDSAKEENHLVLTYHRGCKRVTCVCGVVIEGCHTCSIMSYMLKSGQAVRVIFRVCDYTGCKDKRGDECQVCIKEENFQKYLDSSYKDRDGYEYCSSCDEHIHCCSCVAFIDRDGKEKCKKCKKLWTGSDVQSGECDGCGYEGD